MKQYDFISTSVASSAKLKIGKGGRGGRGELEKGSLEKGELEKNRYMKIYAFKNFQA